MTIGFEFANEPILRLMNSPENLMADIKGYMAVIYGGLTVTAAYNALAAVLRALGDSKSPLYFLIISAIINVVLDIVFIVNFGMGVEGCGYATVIAQAVSALLCLIYIVKNFRSCGFRKKIFGFPFRAWDGFWHWEFPWDCSFLLRRSEQSSCRGRSIFMVQCTWQVFLRQGNCRIL